MVFVARNMVEYQLFSLAYRVLVALFPAPLEQIFFPLHRYNRFEKEKYNQQILGQELDRLDEERALDDRDAHRRVLLDNMKRNRTFVDEWMGQGWKDWENSMLKQRTR